MLESRRGGGLGLGLGFLGVKAMDVLLHSTNWSAQHKKRGVQGTAMYIRTYISSSAAARGR